MILSYTIFGIFSYYPYWLYKKLTTGNENSPYFKAHWMPVYEIYKDQKSAYFISVVLLRKHIFSMIMVVMQKQPTLQLVVLFWINIAYLIVLKKWAPYKKEPF